MSLSPVGTLTSRRDRVSGATKFELSRGVVAFPSVGDQILIPTSGQIEAIVGAKDDDKASSEFFELEFHLLSIDN